MTNQSTITLFGTKLVNTSIAVKVNDGVATEVASFDCLATWAGDVSLAEGANTLEIFGLNRTGGQGTPITISITLDLTRPNAPSVSSCGPSTSTSPCTLSGTKDTSESVWISGQQGNNDRLVIGPGNTSWSYDVTLTQSGDNTFEVRIQDAAGNKSTATPVTVNFSGTPEPTPVLIYPLGNTGSVSQRPLFKWSGSSSSYKIQVSSSVSFSTLTIDEPVSGTTVFQPSIDIPLGTYFWRVGSINSSGTFYSTARKVTIGRSRCDLNKDGYDDLIVGSYENDAGGPNAGRAFVYLGSPGGPNITPRLTPTGEAPGDRFGISVACAGDVNGDGFADMIVGAFLNDAGGEDAGRAYIFFGGSSPDGLADVMLTGQTADDRFGTSVSAAGDVNGDGYDDVIVGAYRNDGGGADAGRAYIYFGGDNMDTLPDVVLTGETAGDQFGIRVARAGDVNGDGYDDVIVGADGADVGNAANAGKAYLFFGGPNMAGRGAGQADVILHGEEVQDAIFASVNGAGDLNNDGYSDVVVGASGFKTGSGGEGICNDFIDNDGDGLVDRRDPDCYLGQAYIFFGGPSLAGTLSASSTTVLKKPFQADGFGFSVASAGDVNGDGFSDFLVGAFLSDARFNINSTGEICDNNTDDDGDGLIDLNDPDCVVVDDQGRAYLYFGGTTVGPNPNVTFIGEASPGVSPDFLPFSGQFGFSVAGAGDVDGDLISDFLIGAYLHDIGVLGSETDVGKVYYFSGSTTWPNVLAATSATTIFTGATGGLFGPDNGFGVSVQ